MSKVISEGVLAHPGPSQRRIAEPAIWGAPAASQCEQRHAFPAWPSKACSSFGSLNPASALVTAAPAVNQRLGYHSAGATGAHHPTGSSSETSRLT